MRPPSEAELLALWELGVTRHPIDRALLLGSLALPDYPVRNLPDLPLGKLNTALLELRAASFGARLDAYIDCAGCGGRMELALNLDEFLALANRTDGSGEIEVDGVRFRAISSRDLAMVARECDVEAASDKLRSLCCLAEPSADGVDRVRIAEELDARMEELDPLADISLGVQCDLCGKSGSASLDIGALLWEEIEARARALLTDIHLLASAYGWTEPDILALSPTRRAIYLQMVQA